MKKTIIYRILMHALYWAVTVTVFSLSSALYTGQYKNQFLVELLFLPVMCGGAYFTIYFLIPRFLLPKRYPEFFISVILFSVLFGLIDRYYSYMVIRPLVFPGQPRTLGGFWVRWFSSTINYYYIVGMVASIHLYRIWFDNQKAKQELLNEKLTAELQNLKSQIHPHFLFNTLNNLYVLIKKQSDAAPEVLMKLSGLLRYILYECNVPFVPVEKEIQILKDYISLETLRYGGAFKVSFEVSGETNGKTIAPLLLLPFVENSFKHGASKIIEGKYIDIRLAQNETNIKFTIVNNKVNTSVNDSERCAEGIGIANVKRRLELIYGNNYKLNILNLDETFIVELETGQPERK